LVDVTLLIHYKCAHRKPNQSGGSDKSGDW